MAVRTVAIRRLAVVVLTCLLLGTLTSSCSNATASDDDLAKPIDAFMKAASSEDVDAVWQSASDEFRNSETKDRLAQKIRQQPQLFKGYVSVEVDPKTLMYLLQPDGQTVANVKGIVKYSDGSQGTFSGQLVKQNGGWRVVGLNIYVDQSRTEKYSNKGDN